MSTELATARSASDPSAAPDQLNALLLDFLR